MPSGLMPGMPGPQMGMPPGMFPQMGMPPGMSYAAAVHMFGPAIAARMMAMQRPGMPGMMLGQGMGPMMVAPGVGHAGSGPAGGPGWGRAGPLPGALGARPRLSAKDSGPVAKDAAAVAKDAEGVQVARMLRSPSPEQVREPIEPPPGMRSPEEPPPGIESPVSGEFIRPGINLSAMANLDAGVRLPSRGAGAWREAQDGRSIEELQNELQVETQTMATQTEAVDEDDLGDEVAERWFAGYALEGAGLLSRAAAEGAQAAAAGDSDAAGGAERPDREEGQLRRQLQRHAAEAAGAQQEAAAEGGANSSSSSSSDSDTSDSEARRQRATSSEEEQPAALAPAAPAPAGAAGAARAPLVDPRQVGALALQRAAGRVSAPDRLLQARGPARERERERLLHELRALQVRRGQVSFRRGHLHTTAVPRPAGRVRGDPAQAEPPPAPSAQPESDQVEALDEVARELERLLGLYRCVAGPVSGEAMASDGGQSASDWVLRHNLIERLQKERIVVVPHFLPPQLADATLQHLRGEAADLTWDRFGRGSFQHCCLERLPALDGVYRLLRLAAGGLWAMFSAGRYSRGHFLPAHNDKAYVHVNAGDGVRALHSRGYAGILYLTKDWREEDGGAFVDIETGDTVVPEFNKLVAFRVPLWHEVTAVVGSRPRYSLFGWWLLPGRQYDFPGAPRSLSSTCPAGGCGEEGFLSEVRARLHSGSGTQSSSSSSSSPHRCPTPRSSSVPPSTHSWPLGAAFHPQDRRKMTCDKELSGLEL
ncbi:unnamed protein product [Prorocentrum cordatum]|uniref:Prolyl 4-hydroxylase alpha subunit domain-containing protein n=1 Tax=Prorocentrum cordatum TaxID=2364126 RepID=A0ABN9SHA6_9DINO|nr:unnamed protein product [Polarella glacialis]